MLLQIEMVDLVLKKVLLFKTKDINIIKQKEDL